MGERIASARVQVGAACVQAPWLEQIYGLDGLRRPELADARGGYLWSEDLRWETTIMQITPTFSFAAGATQADVTQFEGAVGKVINFYETNFSNANVTLNVDFAYGEQYSSASGS